MGLSFSVRRWLEVASALALLTSAGRVHAAPTARLVYSRAADAATCPDEAALRRDVSARVGYDVFFPWAPRTVVVAIVRHDAAFVATVSLVDEDGIDHGAHELRSGLACLDLLDTVALAVAIAIDPQSTMPAPAIAIVPPPPEPPTPIPMPARAEATVARTASGSDPPPPVRRLRFEASLGGAVTFAMAPTPALGATIGAAARGSRFSLGVEGLIDAPTSTAVTAGGRASAWLTYGAIVPCVYVGPVFGCALAQAGSLQSSGEGVANTTSASTAWLALGGRVGAMLLLREHLFLRFRGDLVGDLRPTTLMLDGARAWQTPDVAGSLGIDAVLRFW